MAPWRLLVPKVSDASEIADHPGEGKIKTGVVEEAAAGTTYQDVCGHGEQGVKGTFVFDGT